jgi:hypothetical protein
MRTLLIVSITLAISCELRAQPVIAANGVVNASGYQTRLAPNAVFVIFGTGMGPASLATASAPYPESLGGTSVSLTPAGGGA